MSRLKSRVSRLEKRLGITERKLVTLIGDSNADFEKMKENYISYEKYVKICKRADIKRDQSQATLVDFLHDKELIPIEIRKFFIEIYFFLNLFQYP